MLSDAAGAYSDKIFCCAPLVRKSPGLILAKSLAMPRRPGIAGAYFDEISCYAPLVRDRRGSFWQNLLLRPAVPISSGLILTKSLAATRCPERSPGLIPTKSLAKPH